MQGINQIYLRIKTRALTVSTVSCICKLVNQLDVQNQNEQWWQAASVANPYGIFKHAFSQLQGYWLNYWLNSPFPFALKSQQSTRCLGSLPKCVIILTHDIHIVAGIILQICNVQRQFENLKKCLVVALVMAYHFVIWPNCLANIFSGSYFLCISWGFHN